MKSHAKGRSFDLWVVQYPFAFWPLIYKVTTYVGG